MVLSVPVPSSRVNCNSFFDFGTATHSLTFTARKSDLLNVSKSTNSSNKGSTFTLEKSIFSDSVFTFFSGASEAVLFTSFFLFTSPSDFIVGKSFGSFSYSYKSLQALIFRAFDPFTLFHTLC